MDVIRFEHTSFSYRGAPDALVDIDLTIGQGEFVCVVGGNGSGKSTLAKHVNALLAPSEGRVRVLGRDTRDAASLVEVRSFVGMVFQNPDDQIVASIVEDEVAFGPENLGVAPGEIRERVTEALGRVGLDGYERREVSKLSGGEKQRLAIAGALAMRPQVLVLDEASSMLDYRGRSDLMALCRELNQAGITIIMITHFIEEAAHATRVVVLESGRIALDGDPRDVLARSDVLARLSLEVPFAVRLGDELAARGVDAGNHVHVEGLIKALSVGYAGATKKGARIADGPMRPSSRDDEYAGVADGVKPALLEFDAVSFSYDAPKGAKRGVFARNRSGESAPVAYTLKDISFNVHRGEMVGIAGMSGSGKSTLLRLCNGLLKPTRGRVLVDGCSLFEPGVAAQARRQLGVVFQYPEQQLFAASVFEDVAFGPRNLGLDETEVERRVTEALAMVHLDFAELRDRSPFALSGGQQRRVAFAGVLAMEPSTLVLDEPTAGLDYQSRESFLKLIEELHVTRGIAMVMASHNMDDLVRLCDRVLVLADGSVCAYGRPSEVFDDAAKLAALGLEMPHAYRVADAFGVAVPAKGLPSAAQLAEALCSRIRACDTKKPPGEEVVSDVVGPAGLTISR